MSLGSNLFIILLLSITAFSYPIDCQTIRTSSFGTLVGCEILNDPYPLKWEATITLSQNYTWRGIDDLFWSYANGNEPVEDNCQTATTLPGPYSKGSNITIQQTCLSFKPKLQKNSSLQMYALNWHSSHFPDPLIFQFKIPGIDAKNNIIENIFSSYKFMEMKEYIA